MTPKRRTSSRLDGQGRIPTRTWSPDSENATRMKSASRWKTALLARQSASIPFRWERFRDSNQASSRSSARRELWRLSPKPPDGLYSATSRACRPPQVRDVAIFTTPTDPTAGRSYTAMCFFLRNRCSMGQAARRSPAAKTGASLVRIRSPDLRNLRNYHQRQGPRSELVGFYFDRDANGGSVYSLMNSCRSTRQTWRRASSPLIGSPASAMKPALIGRLHDESEN
ncbi:hypothetical protein VTN31DRAFT_5625 [Thermomyces dupontii]|uniref:uncharacterized protein n=1 Tax=Talaromyces thermophilus TaxID=28565 RepID=UPI003741FAC5